MCRVGVRHKRGLTLLRHKRGLTLLPQNTGKTEEDSGMILFLSLMVAYATTSLQLLGTAGATPDVKAKRYTINLDLPPAERWTEVIQDHKEELEYVLKLINDTSSPLLSDAFSNLAQNIDLYVPYPYNEEIVGISKLVKDVSVAAILRANVFYEMIPYNIGDYPETYSALPGTSIVAETLNGQILHGRNIDYSFPELKNITITVDFMKSGNISYTGTTLAGVIGLITGQKPNKYTISLNERQEGAFWKNVVETWLSGTNGAISFRIRDVLARDDLSFEDAVTMMSSSPLIAPSYITMGGTKSGEGVIITRDRMASVDQYRLNANNGEWYLLETNYDRWTTPPSSDDRRNPGIKALEELTQPKLNQNGLYNVLSTPPVLNAGSTSTVIMSASNPDIYTTWIRYPTTDKDLKARHIVDLRNWVNGRASTTTNSK